MAQYEVFQSGPRKGQCKTIRDRYIRYFLEFRGGQIVDKSERTVKIKIEDRFIFLGKNGSCRRGQNKTTSRDISDVVMKYMTMWESEKGLTN